MHARVQVGRRALVVGLQGFALVQNDPWGSWGLGRWSEPYFPIALTDEERNQPATYVTISSISYIAYRAAVRQTLAMDGFGRPYRRS